MFSEHESCNNAVSNEENKESILKGEHCRHPNADDRVIMQIS